MKNIIKNIMNKLFYPIIVMVIGTLIIYLITSNKFIKNDLDIKKYQIEENSNFTHDHSSQDKTTKMKTFKYNEKTGKYEGADIAINYDVGLQGKGKIKNACFGTLVNDEIDFTTISIEDTKLSSIRKYFTVVPKKINGNIIFQDGNISEDRFLRGYLVMGDEDKNKQGALLLYNKKKSITTIHDIANVQKRTENDVNTKMDSSDFYITTHKNTIVNEFNMIKEKCIEN